MSKPSAEITRLFDEIDSTPFGAEERALIDQAKQLLAAVPDQRPTYIIEDLRQLAEPYPETVTDTRDDGTTVTTVGSASIARAGEQLTVLEAGTAIDRLRAGAAAIWNSGQGIYAFRVPAELYS